MKNKNKDILFITMLLFSIAVLFLNDRIWKYEYGSWFTGKLSDFTGLLTLPIFISLIFPRTKKYVSGTIGFLFIVWKLPISNPVIETWNSLGIFELSRVIDSTDFWALLSLPLAHLIITKNDLNRIRRFISISVHQLILVPTIFIIGLVFCSTSIPEPAYPKGDILINKSYNIKGKTEAQILSYFKSRGNIIRTDSILYLKNNRTRNEKYYQINEFILPSEYGSDTLYNLNFRIYESINRSSILIINFSMTNKWDLQNWESLKKKTKKYKEIIEKEIIYKIKEM